MASLWVSESVFSLTFYCHLLENCHDDYINLENYRIYKSIVGLAFFGPSTFVQCPTYTTVHGGPVLTILELYQRWPLSASAQSWHCPPLTAVALIRLVITVGVAVTAPARIDAQATVTHKLARAAGLVGGWGDMPGFCL